MTYPWRLLLPNLTAEQAARLAHYARTDLEPPVEHVECHPPDLAVEFSMPREPAEQLRSILVNAAASGQVPDAAIDLVENLGMYIGDWLEYLDESTEPDDWIDNLPYDLWGIGDTLVADDLVLRPYRGSDRESLAALLAEPEIVRWWHDGAIDQDYGWVIVIDGAIAGWVQYDEGRDEWFKAVGFDILITTSRHGRGYGRRALRLVIDHFVARGHHRFTIDPQADNARAIRSYAAVGFREVGVMRRYGRDAAGVWRDNLLMELVVEPS